jgi:alanine racemase
MTFTVHIDGARWRRHTASTRDSVRTAISAGTHQHADGDLVPVAKGNGYGIGSDRLAAEATRLGLSRLAVGTVLEAAALAPSYDGDLLVLTPFEPADAAAARAWVELAHGPHADRIVRTVSSRTGWDTLLVGPGPVRVVVEALTSMGRFGLSAEEILELLAAPSTLEAITSDAVRIEGLALHLPLAQPTSAHLAVPGARWHDAAVAPAPPSGSTARVSEALAWGLGWQQALADLSDRVARTADADALTALTSSAALWVSHLDDTELATLRTALPDIALYARVGTRLWLGDRGALQARGTVLAVHEVARGEASGYRQRRASRAGAVVVVAGGTAHGVALEAPSAAASVRQRAVAAGTGVLEAGGRALSPFHVGGKQRWFAEPPHMQVSLVRVPQGVVLPLVGDELDVDVRMTTVHPDLVVGLD